MFVLLDMEPISTFFEAMFYHPLWFFGQLFKNQSSRYCDQQKRIGVALGSQSHIISFIISVFKMHDEVFMSSPC